jgi:hypothetical protein
MCDENNQLPKEYEDIIVAFYNKIKEDERLKKEKERKKASDEIGKKLELADKIDNLKNEFNKIKWYRFRERFYLYGAIVYLETKLKYDYYDE